MVSVCLPSDALLQHLPSYMGFSYLGQGHPSCDIAAAAAKLLQSCPTLPRDGSPPGSSVPGILQARILEWVAISFSNAWKWKVKVKSLSRVQPPGTPWTAAHQPPPSMGFSRQEYWSGVPLPSPEGYSQEAVNLGLSLVKYPSLWYSKPGECKLLLIELC